MTERPLPTRPHAHVLGDVAERFVISHLPPQWITRHIAYDYGLDLNVERVEGGRVTGKNFSVQVKAIQRRTRATQYVSVQLKASTIAYMRERPEPVLLVVYVDDEKEAYWTWVHEVAPSDVSRRTVNMRVPITRRLTQTDWVAFSDDLIRYFRARLFVDGQTEQQLARFGRYSIDLRRRDLLLKEEADQLEELIERSDCSERDIHTFIEQHPGVFVGGEYVRMHALVRLEAGGNSLIPDFLLEHVSGLCDIMELKLPRVA